MSKTILITGASSGFGRDTAETLFRAGHTVYASMRGTQGKNREAAEALQKLGIMSVELDVNDDASVEAGVKNVLVEAGKIDVLVNNARIMSAGVTEAPRETPAVVVAEHEFTTKSDKTGPMIHQLFVGRHVAENDQIKLPRESVNLVNWLRDLSERPRRPHRANQAEESSADAILTAVYDNGLPRDECGIIAC